MPRVKFEPTIPVFGRAKTVYALDRAATVIGSLYIIQYIIIYWFLAPFSALNCGLSILEYHIRVSWQMTLADVEDFLRVYVSTKLNETHHIFFARYNGGLFLNLFLATLSNWASPFFIQRNRNWS
jgi:hypothetical protein